MSEASDPRGELKRSEIEQFLASALEFVAESRSAIMKRFHEGFNITLKEDSSLVTEADVEAEQLLRDRITKRFPSHGIIGEEDAPINSSAEFQWIIDPIDGTQNFAHGIPTFGTLLALQLHSWPVLGIIDHPAISNCYFASHAGGAFCNDQRIEIRDKAEKTLHPLEIVNMACRAGFTRAGEAHLFDSFIRAHPSIRLYHDCFGHSRAISGQSAAMVEANVRLWDIAPAQVQCEEAGGRYISLGTWTSSSGIKYYSAIFGKRTVVEFLEPLFRRG